jgi:hypothetical protein
VISKPLSTSLWECICWHQCCISVVATFAAVLNVLSCDNGGSNDHPIASQSAIILADPVVQEHRPKEIPDAHTFPSRAAPLRLARVATQGGKLRDLDKILPELAHGLDACGKQSVRNRLLGSVKITLTVDRTGRITDVEPDSRPLEVPDFLTWNCLYQRLRVVSFQPPGSNRVRLVIRLSEVP